YVISGSASDAETALKQLEYLPVDAVLTDLVLPGKSGFDLASELASRFQVMPIVAMTAGTGEYILTKIAKSNFAGAFLKTDSLGQVMLDALGAVLKGRRYVDPEITR